MRNKVLLEEVHRMVDELIQEAIREQYPLEALLQRYQEGISGWTADNVYASGYAFGVLQAGLKSLEAHTETCRIHQGVTYSCNESSIRPISMQLDPHVFIGGEVGVFWKKEKPTDPDRIWFMES